jgi:hypothetical protein
MAIQSPRKKKVPEELRVKAAKNGGFTVRHSYNNFGAGESYQPDDEYAFTSHKEAGAHVANHMRKMAGVSDADGDEGGDVETPASSKKTPKAPPAKQLGTRTNQAPAPTRRTYGAGVD